MAIFPKIENEATLQENDKTRLDATKTFVSKDEAAVTLVRIRPDAAGSFIDVTGSSSQDWFLDWQYSSAGSYVVTVEVTTDGSPITFTSNIEVITAVDDNLFSTDEQLKTHEDDILNWVRNGRSTFLDKHRMAQTRILAYLDEQRIWKPDGTRFVKADVVDILEVQEWSKFETLAIIFEGLSNDVEDIFSVKADKYRRLRDGARSRSSLRLDLNSDSVLENTEVIDIRSAEMVRR